MLSVNVTGYQQGCTTNSGGIGRLFVGDAEDFNFTSGTPDAQTTGYSAIALRTGALTTTGSGLFEIGIMEETGQYKQTQSIANGSSSWAHEITGQVLKVQQSMVQFAQMLDGVNGCNGQLLFVVIDSNGIPWIVGEKYIDGADAGKKFKVKQDGTVLDTGKAIADFNGGSLSFKGNFGRPAYTFTGLVTALTALINVS